MTIDKNRTVPVTAGILFFFLIIIYGFSKNNTHGSDPLFTIYVTSSIVDNGDVDLNEYVYNDSRVLRLPNGKIYYSYPIGTSILAIPPYMILQRYFKFIDERLEAFEADKIIAGLFAALSGVFMFLIFTKQNVSLNGSLFLSILYGLGSSVYSNASTALWSNGTVAFLYSIVLYLILHNKIGLSGIVIGFSYVVRPTSAIVILILSLYILTVKLKWKHKFYYFLGLFLILGGFFYFNYSIYGSILSPYYNAGRVSPGFSSFTEALAGNLISPARGLFIYTPVILFAFYSFQFIRSKIKYYLVAIILVHWYIISGFGHWWGGGSFGPRLFSDLLPFLFFLIYPVGKTIFYPNRSLNEILRFFLLFVILIFSLFQFYIHWNGANNMASWTQWSESGYYKGKLYGDIDTYPIRIWSWDDPQFLRTGR